MLHFTFMSMISFESVFVKDVRLMSRFVFFFFFFFGYPVVLEPFVEEVISALLPLFILIKKKDLMFCL